MLLFYIIIIFLIFCLTGLSFFYYEDRKKNLATYQKQQNTIALLKMEAIRNRMAPHFFFNVLSGISGEANLPGQLKKKFKTMLMLLRRSVDNIEQTAIPVSEELEVVKGYTDLQRWRIPDPLTITYHIGEEIDMNQLIPAMILQIPVENAIRHGLLPLTGEKFLAIKFDNYDSGLKITVEDNGIGYRSSTNRSIGAGTGLKILFQTICLLNSNNSAKIEFTISDRSDQDKLQNGTIVEIKIPTDYSFNMIKDSDL